MSIMYFLYVVVLCFITHWSLILFFLLIRALSYAYSTFTAIFNSFLPITNFRTVAGMFIQLSHKGCHRNFGFLKILVQDQFFCFLLFFFLKRRSVLENFGPSVYIFYMYSVLQWVWMSVARSVEGWSENNFTSCKCF